MRKNTPTGVPCADLGTLVYKSRWLLWNIISLEVYNISYGRPHRRCMKLRERLQNISRGIIVESHIIISRLIKHISIRYTSLVDVYQLDTTSHVVFCGTHKQSGLRRHLTA